MNAPRDLPRPTVTIASLWAVIAISGSLALAADTRHDVIERVGEDIRYFASDELEGRGIETKGIRLAADRILEEYRKYGLKPGMPDGSYVQSFDISIGKTDVTSDTAVKFTNPDGKETRLKMGTDFQAIRRGHNGKVSGELFFVGYGISSAEDDYDEYANHDVAGKILVMIRREPQQGKQGGAFQGTSTSENAYIDRKISLAKQHQAAGILFVNDPFSTEKSADELSPPTGFGTSGSGIPFAHVKQVVINELLKAHPLKARNAGEIHTLSSLQEVSDYIDRTLEPVSQTLTGWTADVITRFDTNSVSADNLIGVIEGEGPLADETLVVGGHYDHLGYGGYGSRAANRKGEIHNGADDNATGTAAVLELVRRISQGPTPKRRVVFICFSGEERGLLGSKHYVDNPVFPLEKTVAMLNYDMIGTLRNNRVEVNGVSTAVEFRRIVEAADAWSPLETKIVDTPFGGSDHLPFFGKNIPVMFCFTGVTDRYHTPDDDYSAINVSGVVDIIDFSERMLRDIVNLPKPPEFQQVSRSGRVTRKVPYLGVVPDLGADAEDLGVPLRSIRPNSPAMNAGLQVGDTIIKANDAHIDEYSDLIRFMEGRKAGDVVTLSIRRGSATVQVEATLAPPK